MAEEASSPTVFTSGPLSALRILHCLTAQVQLSQILLIWTPTQGRRGPEQTYIKITRKLLHVCVQVGQTSCKTNPGERSNCHLPLHQRVPPGGGVHSYFDRPSVLNKMASVLFVFRGETSEHLLCSLEQHAGLELQAAPVRQNA